MIKTNRVVKENYKNKATPEGLKRHRNCSGSLDEVLIKRKELKYERADHQGINSGCCADGRADHQKINSGCCADSRLSIRLHLDRMKDTYIVIANVCGDLPNTSINIHSLPPFKNIFHLSLFFIHFSIPSSLLDCSIFSICR